MELFAVRISVVRFSEHHQLEGKNRISARSGYTPVFLFFSTHAICRWKKGIMKFSFAFFLTIITVLLVVASGHVVFASESLSGINL